MLGVATPARTKAWGALAAGVVLFLLACTTEPCELETRIFETLFSNIPEVTEITEDFIRISKDQGFDCSSETIRDAFGRAIGAKWTCTRCE